MKKKIITISIIAVVIIGFIIGLSYFLSFKKVTIKLSAYVSDITIYSKADFESKKNPQKVSSNQTINLQNGDYIIIPNGDKISSNQINITITKDTDINIDPDYSEEYLNSLLSEAKNSVYTVLAAKYPNIINNYSIQTNQLFIKGEWFGGLLVNNESNRNNIKDSFRFVAYKENGVWQIINYPDLILSKSSYSKVPIEILNTVNNFSAEN